MGWRANEGVSRCVLCGRKRTTLHFMRIRLIIVWLEGEEVITYIIGLWLASLLLGYELAFTGATLAIGRSIGDTDGSTGFQDAITPPWSTNFAIVSYVAAIGAVGYGWYQYGWLTGIGIVVGFFFLVVINKVVLLPKSESDHFKRLILRSMINRYADFKKSGDDVRAAAMATLLDKLGTPVPEELQR